MAMALPIIITGLATATGMAGSLYEGEAGKQAAEYNAKIQNTQAEQIIAQSAEEQRRQKVMARKQLGGLRSAVGASGIQLEGSALDVLEESAGNAALDSLNIQHEGELKAWSARAGAQLDLFRGRSAQIQGEYGATASLLKGASGIAASVGGSTKPSSGGGATT